MADNDLTAAKPADGAPAPKVEDIPVQESAPEPLVVATDDDTSNEPEAEAAPAAAAENADADGRKPVQKLPEWADKKLRESAFEAREAKREAKRLADELAALKSAPATAPATPVATADDAAAVRANAPAGGYRTQADFDAAVAAEATRREAAIRAEAAAEEFNTRSNDTFTKGVSAFGDDFKAAVTNLQNVGVMEPDFVSLVLETDDPAKVLFELGSDPDRAANIYQMPAAKRAIEIAKLSVIPTKKPPEPISRAPAPIRPVEGTARVVGDPKDDDDDATWFAKREAELAARRA